MSERKDEDLLKIQIVSEHCHTVFTNKSSLIVGALIGFLVLFYTFLYSGTFSPLTFWVLFFSWSGVCLYYVWKLSKEHYRNLTKISGMIEKVERGETLPSLKKLLDSEINEDEKDPEIQTKKGEMSDNNRGVEMANHSLDRLNLFEAVVFGLYGNWLISLLVDKISFQKYPTGNINVFGMWYQEMCVWLAFVCLILLFVFSIFRPDLINRKFLFILYAGHTLSIWAAFTVEGMTKSNTIFF